MVEPTSMKVDSIPVKVVVRVRPLIPLELEYGATECVTVDEKNDTVFVDDRSFNFDRVFGTKCNQDFIYEETVCDLLDSSFNGYNTTIFAYGQTGSGKTYTMGTGFERSIEDEEKGILPRMIDAIFNKLDSDVELCAKEGYSYEIYASFAEIYNEKVYDLLNNCNDSLSIINSGDDVIVKGLSERRIYRRLDMIQVLSEGSESRRVGATEMNKQSSRSHAIFTITICKCSESEGILRGKINFVDLAGSERLDKTKATGSRAQEGISINKSLSTLSKVIEALVTHQSHIPYRESSLTRLLKDSLGGNAKTVMIACVSPADTNCSETVNTLRWADQARKIQNKPTVNVDPTTSEILKLKQRIIELEEIIAQNDMKVVTSETPMKQQQNLLLLEKEVDRLRNALLTSEEKYNQIKTDLDFLLEQKKENGFEELLNQKNQEIERLKQQTLQINYSFTSDSLLENEKLEMDDEEEEKLELDEEEKEQFDNLTQEEKKLSSLLESKKQIQTLKERYESKLVQITNQLDSLTKENNSLHQQLQAIEKKKGNSSSTSYKSIQELKKKLKKNELTIAQLQKWKNEYDKMIGKYKQKECEVHDLQLSLKQIRAEKIRFQKEVAKKARENELQQRRKELEESKRRMKDRKEQEALEKQIKQLEIQIARMKEKSVQKKMNDVEKNSKKDIGITNQKNLSKQVMGIVKREIHEQSIINDHDLLINKRQTYQKLIDQKEKEINTNDNQEISEDMKKRLAFYRQEKSVLTAKINRLNKQISLAASPSGISRWTQFSTFDQLRSVCDVLLEEVVKQSMKVSEISKEKDQMNKEKSELVIQLKEEESKTAFLLSQLASEEQEQSTTQSKSSLEAFLAGQLEIYQDQKRLLEMELDEEKTLHQAPICLQPKSSYQITPTSLQRNQLGVVSHNEDSLLNDSSFFSSKSLQKKRNSPSSVLPASKRLSPNNYEDVKEYLSQQQRELSTFSLDDLKLPKIENSADSIDKTLIESYQEKRETMSKEEKEQFAKQQQEDIDRLLSKGCNCKGKCLNRKCPCRNFGMKCSKECLCSIENCCNRSQFIIDENDDTIIESP